MGAGISKETRNSRIRYALQKVARENDGVYPPPRQWGRGTALLRGGGGVCLVASLSSKERR